MCSEILQKQVEQQKLRCCQYAMSEPKPTLELGYMSQGTYSPPGVTLTKSMQKYAMLWITCNVTEDVLRSVCVWTCKNFT